MATSVPASSMRSPACGGVASVMRRRRRGPRQMVLHGRPPLGRMGQLGRVVGARDDRQPAVRHRGRQRGRLVDQRMIVLSHDDGGRAGDGGEVHPRGLPVVTGGVGAHQLGAETLDGVGVHGGEGGLLLPLPLRRRVGLDEGVLGATEAQRRRHPLGRVERVDEAVDELAHPLVGRDEGPGGGVHEDQRAHEVRPGQDDAHDDPAAHGMAQQVDRAAAHRIDERAEVRRQLPDGVALEPARPGRVPVPALVERDHAAIGRQRVRRQREVERGAREPVAEHQGRGPRRTAPPLGPRQVDAVDVEGPGRCHDHLSSCSPSPASPGPGRRGGPASSPSRSRAPAPSPATRVRSRSAPRPGAPPA